MFTKKDSIPWEFDNGKLHKLLPTDLVFKEPFTGWDLWREPLRRVFFAFLFFFFLSVALGFTLPLIVQH